MSRFNFPRTTRVADVARQAVIEEMAPGMMEVEIQGFAQYVMSRNGGEEPAIRTAVRSGPRGAAHHVPPSRRRIRNGDMVWVDFSASCNRCHANLARIFSIGEPDRRWTDLHERAAGSVEVVLQAMKPGDGQGGGIQTAELFRKERLAWPCPTHRRTAALGPAR